MKPFPFTSTQPLRRIYKKLEELGYKRKSDEPRVYARGEEELKIQMGKLGPLGKRTLEYEGGLKGLGELKEKKLDQ